MNRGSGSVCLRSNRDWRVGNKRAATTANLGPSFTHEVPSGANQFALVARDIAFSVFAVVLQIVLSSGILKELAQAVTQSVVVSRPMVEGLFQAYDEMSCRVATGKQQTAKLVI